MDLWRVTPLRCSAPLDSFDQAAVCTSSIRDAGMFEEATAILFPAVEQSNPGCCKPWLAAYHLDRVKQWIAGNVYRRPRQPNQSVERSVHVENQLDRGR